MQTPEFSRVKELNKEQRMSCSPNGSVLKRCGGGGEGRTQATNVFILLFSWLRVTARAKCIHSFIETENQISVICCSFALKNCHFIQVRALVPCTAAFWEVFVVNRNIHLLQQHRNFSCHGSLFIFH